MLKKYTIESVEIDMKKTKKYNYIAVRTDIYYGVISSVRKKGVFSEFPITIKALEDLF